MAGRPLRRARSKKAETRKVRYGRAEIGWAESRGQGKWEINNVPFNEEADVNAHDVVTLKEVTDDYPQVKTVVSRKYTRRYKLRYSPANQATYTKIDRLIRKMGWRPEGAVAGHSVIASNALLPEIRAALKTLRGVKTSVGLLQRYKAIE